MTRTLKIVAGDVVVKASSGQLEFVKDKDKASQAIRRMLGLNAPEGADLDSLVGRVVDDEFAVNAAVQSNVRGAFDRLVRAQRGLQFSSRSTSERLATIQRMYVVPATIGGTTSKTGYAIRLDVLTVEGQLVRLGSVLASSQGG